MSRLVRLGIDSKIFSRLSTSWILELPKLDTFYNALQMRAHDQDSLNSAAGGNFLDKRPADCSKASFESKFQSSLVVSEARSGMGRGLWQKQWGAETKCPKHRPSLLTKRVVNVANNASTWFKVRVLGSSTPLLNAGKDKDGLPNGEVPKRPKPPIVMLNEPVVMA
ncbi:hypothetical protein Tco_0184348 [Tanacetum coccineum]